MAVLNYYDGSKYVPLPIGSDTTTVGAYGYSEDEQVVGCWINGKPIYRRVYSGMSITTTSGTWASTNITINNIEKFIYTFFISASGTYSDGCLAKTTSPIQIRTDYGATIETVIFEYTKTTDAENSFTIDMLTSTTVADSTATDEEVEAIFEE